MSLFAELRRRNVIRVGVAYAVAAWILVQILELAVDVFAAPDWVMKIVITLLVVGILPVLMFSWVYELTPEGVKKESDIPEAQSITAHTAKKLDIAVIALLVAAIALLFVNQFDGAPDGVTAPPLVQESASDTPEAQPNPPASATESVVAVLPFQVRSAAGDNDRFLADGIHDDLLTQLARLGAFRVISRTSVMEYLGTTKNMRQIGEELGATAILEGGMQQAGERFRINVQLIDTATDAHLWADAFERDLNPDNVFAIQAEIARAIASALNATLNETAESQLNHAPPTSSQAAYEAFLRGRLATHEYRPDATADAVRHFKNAVQLDPEFGDAWSWLGFAYLYDTWGGGETPAEDQAVAEALKAIETARRIDPDSTEAIYAEAHYHYFITYEYAKAIDLLDPLIERYPSNADYVAARGWMHRRTGDWELAIADLKAAAELDPRNDFIVISISETLGFMRQWDQALAYLEKGLAIAGKYDEYLVRKARLRWQCCGDLTVARDAAERGLRHRDGVPVSATLHLIEGRADKALAVLNSVENSDAEPGTDRIRRLTIEAIYRTGDVARAAAEARAYEAQLRTYQDQHPGHDGTLSELAITALAQNDTEGALALFAESDRVRRNDQYYAGDAASKTFHNLAVFGQLDRALAMLPRVLAMTNGMSRQEILGDAAYAALRAHPEFETVWSSLDNDS